MKNALLLAAALAAAPAAVTLLLPAVPGTVALYALDEGSGPVAADAMGGSGSTATIRPSFEWVGGLSGSAIRLYDTNETKEESYGRIDVRPIEVGSVYTLQAWTCFPLESTLF